MYARIRVRDSSEKPATCVASEVQTWHATSLPAYSPTPKRKRRGHAQKSKKYYLDFYNPNALREVYSLKKSGKTQFSRLF
jgi:hypothetical protein